MFLNYALCVTASAIRTIQRTRLFYRILSYYENSLEVRFAVTTSRSKSRYLAVITKKKGNLIKKTALFIRLEIYSDYCFWFSKSLIDPVWHFWAFHFGINILVDHRKSFLINREPKCNSFVCWRCQCSAQRFHPSSFSVFLAFLCILFGPFSIQFIILFRTRTKINSTSTDKRVAKRCYIILLPSPFYYLYLWK